ncbi:MAG: hypothetical protein LC808_31740 [Actinobacteria bacterium]|nr:hypothetical protein [Actinomycetota bacterium]
MTPDGTPQRIVYVAPLLDAVRARGYNPETVAMDRGYDNTVLTASGSTQTS